MEDADGRVVNWNAAYRRRRFIFSHGDTYHRTIMTEPTASWERLPWTSRLEREVMAYLDSRRHGGRDWIWFHERPVEDVAEIGRRLGVDFSRRKAMQPCPPAPALMVILASSINVVLFHWQDRDESSRHALIIELHNARDLRKKRVVFADAHIDTRLEARSPLPDKNRSTRYQLARKTLHAQPLGMTIAAVS